MLHAGLILVAVGLLQFGSSVGQECSPMKIGTGAKLLSCSNDRKVRSVCTLGCTTGFNMAGGGTRKVCWCTRGKCTWQGAPPVCKEVKCPAPDYNVGSIRVVSDWTDGFAALIEFEQLPSDMGEGWSIAIAFEKPLGKAASLFSWSTRLTASSPDKRIFTLNNADYNRDFSDYFHTKQNARTLMIVTNIEGSLPTRGYVGLYKTPVKDASCLQITQLRDFVPLPSIAELNAMASVPVIDFETTTLQTADFSLTDKRDATTTTTTTAIPTTTLPVTTKKPWRRRWQRRRTTTTTNPIMTSVGPTNKTNPISHTPTTTIGDSLSIDLIITSPTTKATTTVNPNTPPPLKKINDQFCKLQTKGETYTTEAGWLDGGVPYFSGNAYLYPEYRLTEWSILIVFDQAISAIEVWNVQLTGHSDSGYMWTFGPHSWNTVIDPNTIDVSFLAKQRDNTGTNPMGLVYLCSTAFDDGDIISTGPDDNMHPEPTATTPSVVNEIQAAATEPWVTVSTTTISAANTNIVPDDAALPTKTPTKAPVVKMTERCKPTSPSGIPVEKAPQTVPKPKENTDGTKYNYNELLHLSILFYEAQRSGFQPARYKRIKWRGHAGLKDGCQIGVDLSKGWFDAADHVKFNFPMSFSVTLLSWGGIIFRDAYKDAGELTRLIGSIKWPVDYLMACHISKNELVGQIGDPKVDHKYWGRPEELNTPRPVYTLTPDNPGSDLAGETAAALAAASIVFRKTHPKLYRPALNHAKEIFEFADTFRGKYDEAIPAVRGYYNSVSGYKDELLWSAAWMYKATGEDVYLNKARMMYDEMQAKYYSGPSFSWENKLAGAQGLLANITGEDIFRNPFADFLDKMIKMERTPQGLMYNSVWAPNRYAANVAFLALVGATLEPPLPRRKEYLEFGTQQIHLMLGDSGRSYVVGFGHNYPKRIHHRSSSCGPYPTKCTEPIALQSQKANPYILYGALVGGPANDGSFKDDRKDYKQSEVACDYNAGYQSAVAGLKYFAMKTRPAPKATAKPVRKPRRRG